MPDAIRFHAAGGPEVLKFETVTVPPPAAGEVTIRQESIGINFIDIYHRTGAYKVDFPSGIGLEGAGVVEALGPGVTTLAVGDRVAYCRMPLGAYSTQRNYPAINCIKLPDNISFDTAAAIMLKGLTAQYLLRRIYKVKSGDTILIHAAAGGVGLMVCQWAKALGATVIGTVGTDDKAALAKANGCDHPIVYTRENFVERVKAITAGKGLPVVYDSVGKDTFMQSLDCLQPMGMMVLFGAASGPVPPFDLGLLAAKGSLFITRPTLFTYTANRGMFEESCAELFDVVGSGKVKVRIERTYALKDAAQAHTDLASRKTTGALLLKP